MDDQPWWWWWPAAAAAVPPFLPILLAFGWTIYSTVLFQSIKTSSFLPLLEGVAIVSLSLFLSYELGIASSLMMMLNETGWGCFFPIDLFACLILSFWSVWCDTVQGDKANLRSAKHQKHFRLIGLLCSNWLNFRVAGTEGEQIVDTPPPFMNLRETFLIGWISYLLLKEALRLRCRSLLSGWLVGNINNIVSVTAAPRHHHQPNQTIHPTNQPTNQPTRRPIQIIHCE